MGKTEVTRVLAAMKRDACHGIHTRIVAAWDPNYGPRQLLGFEAVITEPNPEPASGHVIDLGRIVAVPLERSEAIELLQAGAPWDGPAGEEPRTDEIEILRTDDRYTWTVVVGGERQNSSHPRDFSTSNEAFAAAQQYTVEKWRDVVFVRVARVRVA
ncbi:MAG: hypothetical protein ACTHU0_37025 [Kofleriaceae bacterium]